MPSRRLLQSMADAHADRVHFLSAPGAGLRWWPTRHHFMAFIICAHVALVAYWAYRFVVAQRRARAASRPHREPPRKVNCTYEWSNPIPRSLALLQTGSLPGPKRTGSEDGGTPRTPITPSLPQNSTGWSRPGLSDSLPGRQSLSVGH